MIMDKYYTLSEASKCLGISRPTMYRWIKEKRIHTENVGREVLITKTDVKLLVAEKVTILEEALNKLRELV